MRSDLPVVGIANPDNVASVHGHNAILIAEDTGKHVNNIMWKYAIRPDPVAVFVFVASSSSPLLPFTSSSLFGRAKSEVSDRRIYRDLRSLFA